MFDSKNNFQPIFLSAKHRFKEAGMYQESRNPHSDAVLSMPLRHGDVTKNTQKQETSV